MRLFHLQELREIFSYCERPSHTVLNWAFLTLATCSEKSIVQGGNLGRRL
jgi:hypothetical protein